MIDADGPIEFADLKAAEAIKYLILWAGDDPERPGLKGTPLRVVRAFREMFSGYAVNVNSLLKTFEEGDSYDQMIVVKDIPFNSFCEHHMLPFAGVAHVGYIPSARGGLIGLSKIPRVVEAYARRLQLQERITAQVARAVFDLPRPQPEGSGCVIEATHHCVACRGVKKHGVKMVTSDLFGAFKTDPTTRAEFLRLCNGG